jgi:D-sedoheptulose 7-phosphate isomerase
MFQDYADRQLTEMKRLVDQIDRVELERIVEVLLDAHARRAQVFIIGNGGSAATASHFACDLGRGASVPGHARFKVLSLSDAIPTFTAISNDLSYDDIFREQLINLFDPGDVVIGISCSGNSENVVRALAYAKEHGGVTIGLLGFGGGKMQKMVDRYLTCDSYDYGLVESVHLLIEHIISFSFKERFEAQNHADN